MRLTAPPRVLGALLASVLGAAGPLAAQPPSQEVRDPGIEALVAPLVGNEVPGLAVLVMHHGRVVHRAAYGVASVRSGSPATLRTPFYIASTGKMLTAAAVLSLVDEGRVRLADSIGRFVPTVPDYAHDVTVEQLLTHSSGLADHYDLGGVDRTYSNGEVVALLHEAGALRSEPGSRPSYSNSGYVLLAMLVEHVSGRPFATFLRERLFTPAGMDDAVVVDDTADRPADRAIGHRRTGPGAFERYDYESTTTGAGGIYASLRDLERWYLALREGRVLEPATLARASRPPALQNDRPTPYGMGWLAEFAARGPLRDRWYVFAFGGLRGFRSVFQWYQEDDVLVVWLSNGDGDAVLDALRGVPEMLLATPR